MNPRATSLSHESRVVLSLRWIDERKIRKDKVEEGDATYTPKYMMKKLTLLMK